MLFGMGIVIGTVIIVFAVWGIYSMTQTVHPARSATFGSYRLAIKTETGVDIEHYRENLKGGKADGKDITQYSLVQLLKGISVEVEHTNDKMIALEIASDHLEEFPEYYTYLEVMEKGATPKPLN